MPSLNWPNMVALKNLPGRVSKSLNLLQVPPGPRSEQFVYIWIFIAAVSWRDRTEVLSVRNRIRSASDIYLKRNPTTIYLPRKLANNTTSGPASLMKAITRQLSPLKQNSQLRTAAQAGAKRSFFQSPVES